MQKSSRNYDDMNERLGAVGFETDLVPGRYSHRLFKGRIFDFTALSVEGAMTEVFNQGQEAGKEGIRSNLKMLIFGNESN